MVDEGRAIPLFVGIVIITASNLHIIARLYINNTLQCSIATHNLWSASSVRGWTPSRTPSTLLRTYFCAFSAIPHFAPTAPGTWSLAAKTWPAKSVISPWSMSSPGATPPWIFRKLHYTHLGGKSTISHWTVFTIGQGLIYRELCLRLGQKTGQRTFSSEITGFYFGGSIHLWDR